MPEDHPSNSRRARIPRPRKPTTDPPTPPTDTVALGMARHLTDPAIEAAIQAFVATAPPLPDDTARHLGRLLRTRHCHERQT
jgi:hypothetical protein